MRVKRLLTLLCLSAVAPPSLCFAEFKAGVAVVDVTPDQLPAIVNGSMLSRSVGKVNTRLNARAFAFSDDNEKLVIVVVDSCMIGRELLDEAKKLASDATGVKADRILISATHTHSAASSMGCLGTDADPNYVPLLRARLVEAVKAAVDRLEPAQIGYGVIDAEDYTAVRRWIRRPDRRVNDPFGNPTVRANMHAGRVPADVVGESGPEDPNLSLISIKSKDGRPLGVLANFSMHYFGDSDISADYYGLFSEGLKQRISPDQGETKSGFVGAMSHGCSGDIWRFDYTKPDSPFNKIKIDDYVAGLLDLAMKAYDKIEYKSDVKVAMAETRLHLNYRVPDQQRLAWSQKIVEAMGDRLPKDTQEIYAREQVMLHEKQSTDVVVQALRIGDIAIATTPTETYAITGWKVKLQSPLKNTMVIELANGGDGYIPPVEQHLLGGYNTWPARSAGLEVQAESKITAAALALLTEVTGKQQSIHKPGLGESAKKIQQLKPAAWYRLEEFAGPLAADASGNHRDGILEAHVAYFLEGPDSKNFSTGDLKNRSVHFTGDRLRSTLPNLKDQYTVSMWVWNGLPADSRDVTGWMFSRGRDHALTNVGDHLGLGGKNGHPFKLIYQSGNSKEIVAGATEIPRWTWAHVALVRDGKKIQVYLNGAATPEITAEASSSTPADLATLFFGGKSDNSANWEGRMDEIAIFDRVLTPQEITSISK